MAAPAKPPQGASPKGAVPKAPAAAPAAPGEMSKTEKNYREMMKRDPQAFIRQADFTYVKKLYKPDLTHDEFCTLKIQAHTAFWEEKRKNPAHTSTARAPKTIMDPEALEKKKKSMEAARIRFERMQEQIKNSEKAIAAAAKK